MYTINSVDIENDVLVARCTITFKDNYTLDVTVPCKLPKDSEEVLRAIDYRYGLEVAKYDAAPTLTTIKADIEGKFMGKASTEFVRVK